MHYIILLIVHHGRGGPRGKDRQVRAHQLRSSDIDARVSLNSIIITV